MEPLLSTLTDKAVRNVPHDMLERLYREIGISAVAAALEISGDALEQRPTAKQMREAVAARQAA